MVASVVALAAVRAETSKPTNESEIHDCGLREPQFFCARCLMRMRADIIMPMNRNQHPLAEVIAVGDEMTSGQRLDTNTQWLAQQLNSIGIEVAYHATVGDDLQRQTDVIRTAMNRANLVLMTGGLGPTKDDLTRQAIADAAGVGLELDESAVAHIESIFARNNRTMSPTNRNQGQFPVGGKLIHNEEGTAPGIDFKFGSSRVFAMPGVPYEMKLMWESYVADQIVSSFGSKKVIRHHALRCFGIGESEAESRMPDLIARDREPRVGITASKSIISFRITAVADSDEACHLQIDSTSHYIRETLGEVVFGENDDRLCDATFRLLSDHELSVSFVDFQFGSVAASLLREGIPAQEVAKSLPLYLSLDGQTPAQWTGAKNDAKSLDLAAVKIREQSNSDIGIAVGRIAPTEHDADIGKFEVAISIAGESGCRTREFSHVGHSSMRLARSANQVVNFLRLVLISRLENE